MAGHGVQAGAAKSTDAHKNNVIYDKSFSNYCMQCLEGLWQATECKQAQQGQMILNTYVDLFHRVQCLEGLWQAMECK